MFENELRRVSEMREEMSRLYAAVGAEGVEADAQALADLLEGIQALDNATQATQLAILAHLATIETEFTTTVTERHHGLGHISLDAAPTVAVHTGTTTDAASRRVSLAAAMASRFPGILDDMAKGGLHPSTATKVVTMCEELDAPACRRVEEALRSRLGAMDPSRVRSETRRAIQRVALSESAAVVRRSRDGRTVDISPGPDGMTYWWAMLPAETSNAMWASIRKLAKDYKAAEPDLSLQEARADALADLVLSNVSLTTEVTLGIPVLSSDTSMLGERLAGAEATPGEEELVRIPESLRHSTPFGDDQHVATAQAPAWVGDTPVFVSGVEIPNVGYIPPDAVSHLLTHTDVAMSRALLDATTGVLLETSSNCYRTPSAMRRFIETRDGTCRMYGCSRPATKADVDHRISWPDGDTSPPNLAGLCRRHHRTKQQPRWRLDMTPDGTCTWVTPTGKKRFTYPAHRVRPSPPPTQTRVDDARADGPRSGITDDPPPF